MTLFTIESFLMMKLKGESQVWINPFGILEKIGIIFPLGFGIGIGINLQSGVPILTYLEIEAGFAGCGSKMHDSNLNVVTNTTADDDDDDDDASAFASALSALGDGFSAAALGRRVGGGASAVPRLGGGVGEDAIPGIESISCDATDLYGSDPTVAKIALVISISASGIPSFGLLVVLRKIYLLRLILMMIPKLSEQSTSKIVQYKTIFDLIGFDKLEISLNPMPFPVETYGGTVIESGLKINVVNFNFFNLINVRRFTLHIQPAPMMIEAHLFVDPILIQPCKLLDSMVKYVASLDALNQRFDVLEDIDDDGEFQLCPDSILDWTLLEVKGVGEDGKFEARETQAKAAAERAEAKAAALEGYNNKADSNGAAPAPEISTTPTAAGSSLPSSSPPPLPPFPPPPPAADIVCGERQCTTCARVVEGEGPMSLTCSRGEDDNDNHVIAGVAFAAWGVADEQPEWNHASTPGRCGVAPKFDVKGMRAASPEDAKAHIADACLGKATCFVHPQRALFGSASDASGDENPAPHALSVAVRCQSEATYLRSLATTLSLKHFRELFLDVHNRHFDLIGALFVCECYCLSRINSFQFYFVAPSKCIWMFGVLL